MTVAKAPGRLDVEAAALVASVRPRALAALLAKYPEPEDIGFRHDPDQYNPHSLKKPPTDPKRRVEYVQSLIEQYRSGIERDIERYNGLRDKGFLALSAWDIALGGTYDPLWGLRTALELKSAHISYGLTMMRNLHLELDRLNAANGIQPKPGYF